MAQRSLLPNLLPVGKGAVQFPQEETATLEFLNGFQAGHLAYRVYWQGTSVSDTVMVVTFVKRHHTTRETLPYECGYLVGWVSTLIHYGQLMTITHDTFRQGYQDGLQAYFQRGTHPVTLDEILTLLSDSHGENSASHVGFLYGFLKALTLALQTMPRRIPGEEQS